ncbi:MAG: isoprenoid biosynthesis glyoxalase ElbB [Proteobacteria bacterium]|nr:isoprenoid biosynthesis glyoxalase ElbB [Pseudomonadota bacterium]
MSRKRVAVVLSGCGVYDGAEIHEAVATLVALEKNNIEAVLMAPDIDQMHVVNHLTGEEQEGETRNVLVEAARIARGKITTFDAGSMGEVDGLFFVGGFGAAKNLSNYALSGAGMAVQNEIEKGIINIHQSGKPIGAICISPVLIAKVLGEKKPDLTLGRAGDDSENLEKLGANHKTTTHEEVVVDERLKIVSGPCYMLDASILNIMKGAEEVVTKFKMFL